MPSRVFMICNSYESGFGHGLSADGMDLSKTPHADAELGEAYQIGYEAGQEVHYEKKNGGGRMSYVETGVQLARNLMTCQTQPAEDAVRAHLQLMLNKAQALKEERDRMQKALEDICEWSERYTAPGHPVVTVAKRALHNAKLTGQL